MGFKRMALIGVLVLLASGAIVPGKTVGASQGQAYPATPFGVGTFTIPIPPQDAAAAPARVPVLVEARGGRMFYPAVNRSAVRQLLGEILGVPALAGPGSLTVFFLFTGDEPLEVTVHTPSAQRVQVTPSVPRNPRVQQRLMRRWWRAFQEQADRQMQQGDYPPLVETYLTAMLSRRLRLELPSPSNPVPADEPGRTLHLLAGTERLRLDTLRESNRAERIEDPRPSHPLPPAVRWNPPPAVTVDPEIEIEPIARRVPEECFYIRFGEFRNYLWLERLQQDYGGDITRMITLRGYDAQVNQRTQQQLALRSSALAEVFGPALVKDVALIGRDLFLREGPAVGLLFHARDPLLGQDLLRQRATALREQQAAGATEESVEIEGREVSFLSTPDNRLRSFYAVDGDFHLVTTSRAMVARFLQVGSGPGNRSLGESVEFQHARSLMPISREDTIFVYFSAPFFQGLVSPQYQVESQRRLRAASDLDSLRLAHWAARHEGGSAASIEDLIRGDFLPADFGRRPDGSQPVERNGEWGDSLRGTQGTFTPVPDVEITQITDAEARRWTEQAAFYEESWQRLDPLMVGIRRFALEGQDQERVVIDAHISPFGEEKYGWITSMVGPATAVQVQPAPGDVITAQAVVSGGRWMPFIPTHHLFLGIQDHEPLASRPRDGLFGALALVATTPGYLGSWPRSGFLDRLPLGLGGGPPDARGYSRLPLGIYRRQWEDFSALAFDWRLLEQVTPGLGVEEAEDQAQLRVDVGDLSQAALRRWVNLVTFERAEQASRGNTHLLHAMSQQLGVPLEEAREAAEQLLNAQLICSLGGEYRLDERGHWVSDAWPTVRAARPPAEYQAPLLEWFRGLNLQATMYPDRVILLADLDLQRKPAERARPLPLFDLFRGRGRTEPETEQDEDDTTD